MHVFYIVAVLGAVQRHGKRRKQKSEKSINTTSTFQLLIEMEKANKLLVEIIIEAFLWTM